VLAVSAGVAVAGDIAEGETVFKKCLTCRSKLGGTVESVPRATKPMLVAATQNFFSDKVDDFQRLSQPIVERRVKSDVHHPIPGRLRMAEEKQSNVLRVV
jgi:hypothetical protein